MSLRIKLPPKLNEPDYPPEPSLVRRKKRPLTVNSDEEVDDIDPGHIPRPGNSDPGSEEIANETDSRFLHQSRPRPSSDARLKRVKRKATPDGALPAKRKRAVSELDTDDEYAIDGDAATPGGGIDDDEDFEADDKRHSKRARTKTSVKSTKGQGPVSISEFAVEGRKTLPAKAGAESSEARSVIGLKRSRAKPPRLEDAGDATSSPNLSATRSPSPPRETSPPPVAKKRKLPTIKKNKAAGVTGPSTPSSASGSNKPVTAPVLPKQGLSEGGKSAAVRKTPATVGNADFDLRNESVYRELFKSTGGSTPRSGLSRREKDEERRKELNKLKDEAKAKRLLDAKETFDLQAQFEKILRFEERLKYNRSSALYPNFLAGKWRELWERERRHNREKEWQENQAAGKEEGEMIDN